MARMRIPQTSEFPYHITDRIINRAEFPISLSKVWSIFSDELYWMNKKYNFEILSFVLMPNHFHLLGRTSETPLGKILNELLANTSKSMNLESNKINQNWGGRSYKTQVRNMEYFYTVYKYIYQNPLRAGLCTRVEDYPYSTLNGLLGKTRLLIPTSEDTTLFGGEIADRLAWLNCTQSAEDINYIRKGLKFSFFKPPKKYYTGEILLRTDAPPIKK